MARGQSACAVSVVNLTVVLIAPSANVARLAGQQAPARNPRPSQTNHE